MPEERPRRWAARQALAISPQALSALLEAKHHEDDLRMAAALREATARVTHRERLGQRTRNVTDLYELGRLLLSEATATLGVSAGVVAVVGDDAFLEVVASTRALIPAYQSEFLEEAFITGESLRVDTQINSLHTIGNADVPAGTCLRAYPFTDTEGAPLGVLVFEGEPKADRASWLPGFVDFCTRALAECRTYIAAENLLVDAALAFATSQGQQFSPHAAHTRRVSELSRRIAGAMGLGPSDIKRVGLLGALHEVSAEGVESAWTQVRHGRVTGKAWQSLIKQTSGGEIYASPAAELRQLLVLLDELPRGERTEVSSSQWHLFTRIVDAADAFEHVRMERTPSEPHEILQEIGSRCDAEVISVLKHLFGKPTTY